MCGRWLAKGGNYGQMAVRLHSSIKTYNRIKTDEGRVRVT